MWTSIRNLLGTRDDLLLWSRRLAELLPVKFANEEYVKAGQRTVSENLGDFKDLGKKRLVSLRVLERRTRVRERWVEGFGIAVGITAKHFELPHDLAGVRFMKCPFASARTRCLVAGEYYFLRDDPRITKLVAAVRRAFAESWSKRGSITIGPEAEELVRQGWRLVHDLHLPKSYDLKLPRPAAKRAVNRRPRGFAESCKLLKKLGLLEGKLPKAPPIRTPDPLGDGSRVSLFRTLVEDADLSGVTLPRTLICRSELSRVKLKDADLKGSFLCWNDLVEVDLTGADLAGADARASVFDDCRFDRAKLDRADLRRSTFRGCSFTGASLRGARLTRRQASSMRLTAAQVRQATLTTAGDEPPGG